MSFSRLLASRPALWGFACLVLGTSAAAQASAPVAQITVPSPNLDVVAAEDDQRELQGLPPRFAIPEPVYITPDNGGSWENLDEDTVQWKLRVTSPGALSLNFGFTSFWLPEGAELQIRNWRGESSIRPFTAADNADYRELWTPVIITDDALIVLTAPMKVIDQVELALTSINVGYRFFGEKFGGGYLAGACNNDVVCPEGDPWREEIPSVAVISTGGSTFCTGFMVNNTAQDETPFFMTAAHCGSSSSFASSLVTYWNFESPICGNQSGGVLNQFNTGSTLRATYSPSDVTLVELNNPVNPAYNVSYAGWDRTSADASTACAIHHPATDEKSISFEYDPTFTSSYLGTSSPGDGTHVWVVDWDDGTTEPGSSGSPLFDQNHRVVGQLHGGYAACGNDLADWYGRFSVSWNSGGIGTWLDPIGSGATTVDTLAPWASGMRVSGTQLDAQGDPGGPFTPSSTVYTIENRDAAAFSYTVTNTQNWVTITNGSGTIPGGGSTTVTVSINANANSFPIGTYNDLVTFTNVTTHDGDTDRPVTLQVGVPSLKYSFPLDTNPGWTTQGQSAYGSPTGGGGQYGNPDPTSGHTSANCYGYNLAGDYTNNMPEYHLTSAAIDCSDLTAVSVKFWRYLNVETPSYDHAYVRVSTDLSNWTTVWENGGEITDSAWTQVEYDLSAVADNAATVYVRWTMGTTDSSWLFSGWNIDDVEIFGLQDTGVQSYCTGKTSSLGCAPYLTTTGVPSLTATTPFRITANDCIPNQIGYYIYSTQGRLNLNFHGGKLCVKSPFIRLFPAKNSGTSGGGACAGKITRDFNGRIQSGNDPLLTVGAKVNVQNWHRDPADIYGFGDGLSDAVEFVVQP